MIQKPKQRKVAHSSGLHSAKHGSESLVRLFHAILCQSGHVKRRAPISPWRTWENMCGGGSRIWHAFCEALSTRSDFQPIYQTRFVPSGKSVCVSKQWTNQFGQIDPRVKEGLVLLQLTKYQEHTMLSQSTRTGLRTSDANLWKRSGRGCNLVK